MNRIKSFLSIAICCVMMFNYMPSITWAAAGDSVSNPNTGHIYVQKVFEDIDAEDIPENYQIYVTGNGQSYTLSESGDYNFSKSEDGLTWSWTINGVAGGEYSVTESDYSKLNYDVKPYVNGVQADSTTVTVVPDELQFNVVYQENKCSSLDWTVYDNVFFAAALTGNRGCVVITEHPLSAYEQSEISKYIVGGSWHNPVRFYTIDEQISTGHGFVLDGETITYNFDTKKMHFDSTDLWMHIKEISYNYSGGQNPEVYFQNQYEKTHMDIPVQKIWDDNDDQDGKRSDEIIVKLLADGQDTGRTLTLDESNNWSGVFSHVKIRENGTPVTYSIEEIVIDDYDSAVSGNAEDGFTITNTHTPEQIEISGSKFWDDDNNRDRKRPGSIKINLLKNGTAIDSKIVSAADNWEWSFGLRDKYEDGKLIDYTMTEDTVTDYSTSYLDGNVIKNSYTPRKTSVSVTKNWNDNNNEQLFRPLSVKVQLLANGKPLIGKVLELKAADNWQGSFENLPVNEAGEAIVYTVEEVGTIAHYRSSVSGNAAEGFVITNTYVPEYIEKTVTKVWDDNNDQDGMRNSYTVQLYADGEEYGDPVVLDKDTLSKTWSNLPKYAKGKEVSYTVDETAVPTGYEKAVNGFEITNSHTPVVHEPIEVTKVWNDNNNNDAMRPDSVTISLFADGQATGDTLVLSEGNNWSDSFTGLPKFKNGKAIVYTIDEDAVDEYTTAIDGNADAGFTVTNTHETIIITNPVKVVKLWDDQNNRDKIRPGSVKVTLYADGEATDKTLTLSKSNNWKGQWEGLEVYKDGEIIEYSVVEDKVDKYTATYAGDVEDGFIVTNHHMSKDPVTPDNPDVPNTGDMSRLGAWFALLVVALAGALAIRKEEQND